MPVIEHLDGKQDSELSLLERRGLLDVWALRAWLAGDAPASPEIQVNASDAREPVSPAGPRGRRLPG